MREVKEIKLAVKAVDGRQVTWYPAIFGNVDLMDDITLAGSMQASLARRPLLHLWMHDEEKPPISLVKSAKEVGRGALPARIQQEYPDATGGLEVVSDFFTNDFAESVFEAIKAGAPLGGSFAYDVIRRDFVERGGKRVRLLQEVDVFECSTVTYGANPAASGTGKAHRAPAANLKQIELDLARLEFDLLLMDVAHTDPRGHYPRPSAPPLDPTARALAELRAWLAIDDLRL